MPRENSPHPGVPTLDAGEKKFNSRLVALCYSTCFGPTHRRILELCQTRSGNVPRMRLPAPWTHTPRAQFRRQSAEHRSPAPPRVLDERERSSHRRGSAGGRPTCSRLGALSRSCLTASTGTSPRLPNYHRRILSSSPRPRLRSGTVRLPFRFLRYSLARGRSALVQYVLRKAGRGRRRWGHAHLGNPGSVIAAGSTTHATRGGRADSRRTIS
jgi:hypothetical protein